MKHRMKKRYKPVCIWKSSVWRFFAAKIHRFPLRHHVEDLVYTIYSFLARYYNTFLLTMAPEPAEVSDPRITVHPRIRYNTIGGVNGPLVILESVSQLSRPPFKLWLSQSSAF